MSDRSGMHEFLSPLDRASLKAVIDKLPSESKRVVEEAIKAARKDGLEASKSDIDAAHRRGQLEGKTIGTIQLFCRLLFQPEKTEAELSKLGLDELQAELSRILANAMQQSSRRINIDSQESGF